MIEIEKIINMNILCLIRMDENVKTADVVITIVVAKHQSTTRLQNGCAFASG